MHALPSLSRALLVAGLLALGLAACGRRGALEPPPSPSAVKPPGQGQGGNQAQGARPRAARASAGPATQGQATPEGEAVEDDTAQGEPGLIPGFFSQPSQTNDPQRRRPFTVPKEPFILDPLL